MSERCQTRKSQFLFNQVRVQHRTTGVGTANRPRQMIEFDVLHSRAEQVGGYGKGQLGIAGPFRANSCRVS
jgi:hypothetical protein